MPHIPIDDPVVDATVVFDPVVTPDDAFEDDELDFVDDVEPLPPEPPNPSATPVAHPIASAPPATSAMNPT